MTIAGLSISLLSGIVSAIAFSALYKDIKDASTEGDDINCCRGRHESFEEIMLRVRYENAENLEVSLDELDHMSFDDVEERIKELEEDQEKHQDLDVKQTVIN